MKLSLDDLPESLRDVVELIGLAATLKLVEHYGGLIALYVPRELEPDHHLARAIGISAARKLASRYGGDQVRSIPMCVGGLRRLRDAEIRRRVAEGEAPATLVREFGVTERHIWRILAKAPDEGDTRQSALF